MLFMHIKINDMNTKLGLTQSLLTIALEEC